MLKQYVDDICKILKIKSPHISFDTSHFQSETMLAQCDPSSNTIYIREYQEVNPDIFFAVAHELRHVWQVKTDESLYFSSYKTVDKHNSVDNYNMQIAEIDAHAFAALMMSNFFGIKPLFNNLSDNVKTKINERMKVIINTEFS